MDFYTAFTFLKRHPSGNFIEALYVDVAKVNPETGSIDNDSTKNTQIEIWLESGPECGVHDIMLDCGGRTFEEAIINLAKLVMKYYE